MRKLPILETAMLSELGQPITDLSELPDLKTARADWERIRTEYGFRTMQPLLSAPGSNVKLDKTVVPIFGLTLAPAGQSGIVNACPWATAGCAAACVLVTAGKGSMPSVIRARNARTAFAARYPLSFVAIVASELSAAVAKYGQIRMRLNVASDVRWERVAPALFGIRGVDFYDYSKAPVSQRADLPANYRITQSVSERTTDRQIRDAIGAGRNVAAVLRVARSADLPATWQGLPVVDGDSSEDRYADPIGVVVGLRAKGAALSDSSGFVRELV